MKRLTIQINVNNNMQTHTCMCVVTKWTGKKIKLISMCWNRFDKCSSFTLLFFTIAFYCHFDLRFYVACTYFISHSDSNVNGFNYKICSMCYVGNYVRHSCLLCDKYFKAFYWLDRQFIRGFAPQFQPLCCYNAALLFHICILPLRCVARCFSRY